MRALATMIAAAFITVLPAIGSAQRLTDKDMKDLLERINHERDRFEDQLDGNLKRSILRGPGGEVNVERYLDDLQENVGKLKDRFSSSYAAGPEVTTVLRQGGDIQRYMAKQPPNFKGASEWNHLASSLNALANAYGATFPPAEGATARRLGDTEVANAASGVARAADQYKKELDSALKKDKSIDKGTRENAIRDVEALKKDAEELASRVKDGKPSSGEATQLVEHAKRIQQAAAAKPASPGAQRAWGTLSASLATVAQGLGVAGLTP